MIDLSLKTAIFMIGRDNSVLLTAIFKLRRCNFNVDFYILMQGVVDLNRKTVNFGDRR